MASKEIVSEILHDEGTECIGQDGKGVYGSALWAACEQGYQNIIELILGTGPEKTSHVVTTHAGLRKHQILPPLSEQQKRRCARVVELILDKGVNVNVQTGIYGNALQVASLAGQHKVIKVLLDRGADVNMKGGKYGTALQAASSQGRTDVVKLVLDSRADPNL
ncbi:MAG: hypothetical protein M1822_001788 [Bathelium mastoideum]|nr:MAG: hypothetical protein M1822_001788 [Bathelium mastoideum]